MEGLDIEEAKRALNELREKAKKAGYLKEKTRGDELWELFRKSEKEKNPDFKIFYELIYLGSLKYIEKEESVEQELKE